MRGEDRARGIVLRGEETSTIDTVKHPLWLDIVSEGREGVKEGGREGGREGGGGVENKNGAHLPRNRWLWRGLSTTW